MNEKMLKQELEIDEDANVSDLRQIYDPVQMEARQAAKIKPKHIESDEAPAGGGGGGDELGMDMGGGSPPPGDDLGGGLGGDLGGGLGGGADDMGLGAPGAGGGMDNLGL
jgi:hypothetical protein